MPEELEDQADEVFARLEELLGPFPVALGGDDPGVEFGLDEWPDADRQTLTQALVEAEVPHRWNGTTVVVATDAESTVDGLLDAIEQGTLVLGGHGVRGARGRPGRAVRLVGPPGQGSRRPHGPQRDQRTGARSWIPPTRRTGSPSARGPGPSPPPAPSPTLVDERDGRRTSSAPPRTCAPSSASTSAAERRYRPGMLLAELEVWHTRPLAPTRRLALGNLVLPVDPAPGFGGLLLGAVVAGHIGDVPVEVVPDVHRLIDQIDHDQRVVQPRLRHRFQVDRHGLALSTHRMLGDGEEISFDFHTTGTGVAQVLGAVYAVERLAAREPPRDRPGAAQGDALAGRRRAGADRPPRRHQLDGAGHTRRSAGLGDGRARLPAGQRRPRRRSSSPRSSG